MDIIPKWFHLFKQDRSVVHTDIKKIAVFLYSFIFTQK